jgi:hypothetical protein
VTWRWLTPEQREKRNAEVMELWAFGYSRQQIARIVDLTPQRVGQIVSSFGTPGGEAITHRNRPCPSS